MGKVIHMDRSKAYKFYEELIKNELSFDVRIINGPRPFSFHIEDDGHIVNKILDELKKS